MSLSVQVPANKRERSPLSRLVRLGLLCLTVSCGIAPDGCNGDGALFETVDPNTGCCRLVSAREVRQRKLELVSCDCVCDGGVCTQPPAGIIDPPGYRCGTSPVPPLTVVDLSCDTPR